MPNGRVVYSKGSSRKVAVHVCDAGFILVGNPVRKCMPNHTWDGVEPECRCKFTIVAVIHLHYALSDFL